ncbi:sideroflexin-4-like [Pseudophryne corroboree]|uniref:sideroflexin-4-like n=1 Tax=Pseudophryne corroboree TaxID=495146 RepID=UPI0030818216
MLLHGLHSLSPLVEEALKLCEVSVHPDTGDTIPFILRPPALLMMWAPTVVATLLPHRTVMSAFLCQVPFHLYMAEFTLAHRNQSVQAERSLLQQTLYLSASILYLTSVGTRSRKTVPEETDIP